MLSPDCTFFDYSFISGIISLIRQCDFGLSLQPVGITLNGCLETKMNWVNKGNKVLLGWNQSLQPPKEQEIFLLLITVKLANCGSLWSHVCGRGQIVFSPDCVMLPCDTAVLKYDVSGSLCWPSLVGSSHMMGVWELVKSNLWRKWWWWLGGGKKDVL